MTFRGSRWIGLAIGIARFGFGDASAAEPIAPRPKATAELPNATAPAPAVQRSDLTTEQLTELARPSLVVLSSRGRDGTGSGVGTGFVIDPSGLIATSLHVVGEARPVIARLASGRELEVTAVHDHVGEVLQLGLGERGLRREEPAVEVLARLSLVEGGQVVVQEEEVLVEATAQG